MSDVAQIAGLSTDGLRVKDQTVEGVDRSLRPLIERAQSGDAAAFDQLITFFQRKVISLAWRVLGNEADAMDAAQEAFLKLHRYLRSFRTDQDFSAWLYRLVVNACHDTRKKRSKHLSLDQDRERNALEQVAADDDVESSAIAAQDEHIIASALATLSEKERAALVLRDLEGLTTEDVAKVLGSSPTTVRSQICSARAKIKRYRDRVFGGGSGTES